MSEEEFELIDQLYFIKNFDQLRQEMQIDELNLRELIYLLSQKKWLKCLLNEREIEILNRDFFIEQYKNLSFNATKEGLKAHHNI